MPKIGHALQSLRSPLPSPLLPHRCCIGDKVSDEVNNLRDCSFNGGETCFVHANGPYPFGVDPSWRGTKTELPYLNRWVRLKGKLFPVIIWTGWEC